MFKPHKNCSIHMSKHISSMKKFKSMRCLIFGILLLLSCNKQVALTQDQEAERIEKMYLEITKIASSQSCDNSSEWRFTSYGDKACGGPVGYIAYPTGIDVVLFLEKIEQHKLEQKKFNMKWGIVSDCNVPDQPSSVVCSNGVPTFKFKP